MEIQKEIGGTVKMKRDNLLYFIYPLIIAAICCGITLIYTNDAQTLISCAFIAIGLSSLHSFLLYYDSKNEGK